MDVDVYLRLLTDVDETASAFRSQVSECSLIEFRIMDLVAKNPGLCLNEIGEERSVFQQGIGRLAKRLHYRGLVEVVRNDRDGRAKHVILTEEGRKLRAHCRRVLSEIVH